MNNKNTSNTGTTLNRVSLISIESKINDAVSKGKYFTVINGNLMDESISDTLKQTYGYEVSTETNGYKVNWSNPHVIEVIDPSLFISTWETTTINESISLPYFDTLNYSGTIDWGDGTQTNNTFATSTHTYTTPGIHTIKISGQTDGFNFLQLGASALNIRDIKQWGNLKLTNSGSSTEANHSFYNSGLTGVTANDVPNLSGVTNLSFMFANSPNLSTITKINDWVMSGITDISYMFYTTLFNQDVSNWDVSNVTNMESTFDTTLFNQPLSGWNVSNVTNMNGMFEVSPFNQPIGNWDVSNVTVMEYMFFATPFNQPLSGWNVSSVTSMDNMFAQSSFNQPIDNWDVSNVQYFSSMFSDSQFNQPINGWVTSGATNMYSMFLNSQFNQPIGEWDVSNVLGMSAMFYNSSFNQPLSGWNVSNVTDMDSMFTNSSFSQDISDWDVSGVATTFGDFMSGVTLPDSSYLTSIYQKWSLLTLNPNLSINFGTNKYLSGGTAGKNILLGAPNNWTIFDGGLEV